MERAVQILAVIHLVTIGFSHILAPKAWARFFILLRDKGEPGVFAVGFMSLTFGSIIAAFHQVWSGWALVLTLLGWAQVIKAFIYFAWPAFGLRMLGKVSMETASQFVVAGLGLLVLALPILWVLFGSAAT